MQKWFLAVAHIKKRDLSHSRNRAVIIVKLYSMTLRIESHDPDRTGDDGEDDHYTQNQCLYMVARLLSLFDMHEEVKLDDELQNGHQHDRHYEGGFAHHLIHHEYNRYDGQHNRQEKTDYIRPERTVILRMRMIVMMCHLTSPP